METDLGILSIVPPALAIVLAFLTRNAVYSLAVACLVGVLISGQGPLGFSQLMVNAIGNTSFSWVFLLEICIGIMIAFFMRTGAIQTFTRFVEYRKLSRKGVQLWTWVLGMFVFFSDYFSPLFVGTTMRSLADKARISREKLAYIADSTSAPVIVLMPFTGWAIYISGLTIGMGPIADAGDALNAFIHSIPYNIYALTAVVLVGLFAAGLIPEFGPMKKAERRAMDEGKVLRDGAVPLIGRELTETPVFPDIKPRLFLNFILPVILIIVIVLGSFVLTGSAKTLEAYLAVVIFLGISIRIQGIRLNDIMDTAMTGIKGIMPAIMILIFAYTINQLSQDMGTADYMVSISGDFLTPSMLPLATYLLAAVMAFSTGTSWGTFAIMLPIAVPVALVYSGDALTDIVYATIAAVAGGGVFGDHCSPLSDTSILASTGAASDHIDHVRTQIPYAMIAAVLTGAVYLVMGLTVWT